MIDNHVTEINELSIKLLDLAVTQLESFAVVRVLALKVLKSGHAMTSTKQQGEGAQNTIWLNAYYQSAPAVMHKMCKAYKGTPLHDGACLEP